MVAHRGVAPVLQVKVITGVELGPQATRPVRVSHHDAGKEALRGEVNAWLRATDEIDALIDFDAVVRDPDRPSRLRPEFDSGDHLHLQDRGYAAMGDHVDLALLGHS